MQLTQLYIYPIKSLGGIALSQALVTDRGLQYDRRWLLIDENNIFLSQREHTTLALLKVKIIDNLLIVWHLGNPHNTLSLPLNPEIKPVNEWFEVEVWDDVIQAMPLSQEADEWFSTVLGAKTRIVYMPDKSRRMVDSKYAKNEEITSFSDGYPFLIIGESALNHLNQQLAEPLSINRFRPNLVFSGGEVHAEDTWTKFRVGAVTFLGVKPCARCVMTTINQESGEKGKEPLKTLATYRFWNNKIYFGQNLLSVDTGTIRVGDAIEVLDIG